MQQQLTQPIGHANSYLVDIIQHRLEHGAGRAAAQLPELASRLLTDPDGGDINAPVKGLG